MKHVKLRDLDISPIGLGTMGTSFAYTGAGTDDADPPGPRRAPGHRRAIGVLPVDP